MPGPNARQRGALKALRQLDPKLSIEWDEETGAPSVLRGSLSPPSAPVGAQSAEEAARATAYGFMQKHRAIYRLQNATHEFPHSKVSSDAAGTTVRVFQMHRGIEVYDGQLSIALDAQNRVTQVLGRYRAQLRLSIEPTLGVEQAIEAARAHLGLDIQHHALIHTRLLIVNTGSFPETAKLGNQDRLAWRVELLTQVCFVDAHDGSILLTYDNTQTIRNRETYAAKHCLSLPGTLWIRESGAMPDQPVDEIAWSAHRHAGTVYDFYHDNFGLDGFDGRGHKMVSTVHSGIYDGSGCNQNNAAFIPMLRQVVYGDGDGARFGPFPRALDVVAHEWQHACTFFAITWSDGSPRGLDYRDESGALNESYSDFFGTLVEDKDWFIGEDCYTPETPHDALRDMADPARFGQPDHYSEYVDSGDQNRRVHINSGIMNKCAYLMSVGGTHHGVTVLGTGKEAAGAIWYRALRHHLHGASRFLEARLAMLQACQELFPGNALRYRTVQNAFAAVGIGEPAPAAAILVQPEEINFGAVAIGQSLRRTLIANNAGSEALMLSIVRDGDAAFSLADDLAFSLEPGTSRTLTVQFSPVHTGQQQAHLAVGYTNGAAGEVAVALSGSGAATPVEGPSIVLDPQRLSFGTVPIGRSRQRSLTIHNDSPSALLVEDMVVHPAAYSLIGETTFSVEPFDAHAVTIEFRPAAEGVCDGTLAFYSNDPQQPQAFARLLGMGTRCLVSTAAYGSAMEKEVRTLRSLRDQSLVRSSLGRSLVALYYRCSGPVARWIAHSEIGRGVVRLMLQPLFTLARRFTRVKGSQSGHAE
jgi:Zn-dependent metalloprotease